MSVDPEEAYRIALSTALYSLTNTPEWGVYEEQLENLAIDALRGLRTATRDTFEGWKGRLEGIEAVRALPGKFIRPL